MGSSRKPGAGAMAAGLPDSCGRSDWRTAAKSTSRDRPATSLASAADRMPKKATPGAAKKLIPATTTASNSRLANSFFKGGLRAVHQCTNAPVAQTKAPPERIRRGPCRSASVASGGHGLVQVFGDLVEEALGGQPALLVADPQRQVLGHVAALDGVDDDLLERLGEGDQLLVAVQLAAVLEAARPSVDRGDRVGRGGLPLLVLAVVAGDGA